jgi:hypothetical protein
MSQRTRWALIVGVGGTLTVITAALAAHNGADDERLLTFVVFALSTAPVLIGGAWILIPNPNPNAPRPPEHVEESIEHSWITRATSGAFADLIAAMGLAVSAQHVLGAPDVPLELFLVLAFADAGLRHVVLSRREA